MVSELGSRLPRTHDPLVRALLTWSLLYLGCLAVFVSLSWTTQGGGVSLLDQNAVLGGSLAATSNRLHMPPAGG